jgi:hypothetical protein
MSDSEDFGDRYYVSQVAFPPPPMEEDPPSPQKKGWFASLPTAAQNAIRTAEFACVLGCAGVAWSVGGDVVLVAIALVAGWVIGTIGISTAIDRARKWKVVASLALIVFFLAEGSFLYWHFFAKADQSLKASASPTTAPQQIHSALLHEWPADSARE